MYRQNSVAELEEGDALVIQPGPPVDIKSSEKFEANYDAFEELGKGKFGVVKKCISKNGGDYLAAKFIRKTASSKLEVIREVRMMNMLHHKRLIMLHDAFETQKEMIVIMELVTGGELFEKIVEEDDLTERQVIRYMKQVLYAVQHMHQKYMVHLDLKPENILCVGGGKPGYEEIKIIDFGMTRILKDDEQETAMCGTPEFVAPEVITFNPITIAADMWSIGVITYVLLSGLSPFMGEDDSETLKNVAIGEYDYEDDDDGSFDDFSDDVKLFIGELLVLDAGDRLTVDGALSHQWIQKAGSEKKLNTSNLRKFIARRRWQRTMNTIKAVSRLAGGLHMKSNPFALGSNDFLNKVKKQHIFEQEMEDEEKMIREEDEKRKRELEEEQARNEMEDVRLKEEIARKEKDRRMEEEREREKLKNEEEEKLKRALELKLEEAEKLKRQEAERLKKEEAELLRKKEEQEKRAREEEDSKKNRELEEKQKQKELELERERKLKREKERARKKAEREKKDAVNNSDAANNPDAANGNNDNVDENQNPVEQKPLNNGISNLEVSNSSPKLGSKVASIIAQSSPNSQRKRPESPSTNRKNGGGGIKNIAAAFQSGDLYWKNRR